MIRLAIAATLLPTLAAAHAGPAGHAHPHGAELLLLALGAVAAFGIWRASR